MMPDFYVEKGKNESLEMFACRYIIRRTMSCPDFAWRMLGTGALHHCVEAVSEMNGQGVDDIKRSIFDAVEPLAEPEVKQLETKLESSREEIKRLVGVLRSLGRDRKGNLDGSPDFNDEEEDEDDYGDDYECFADESQAYMAISSVKELLHYATVSGIPLTTETLSDALEVGL